MAVDVVSVTRTSVTLAWKMDPDAFGYRVERATRLPTGEWADLVLRAVVYEGLYCDPGLSPDTEYVFQLVSVANPDVEEPEEPVDRQRRRVRTQPPTEFEDSVAFFAQWFAPTFRRQLTSSASKWCPEWWRHPEVRYVMDEIWHSYEALADDPPPAFPGRHRAEWLVSFAYPLLDRLTLQLGPMTDCYTADTQKSGRLHVPLVDGEVRPLPHLVDPDGKYPSHD